MINLFNEKRILSDISQTEKELRKIITTNETEKKISNLSNAQQVWMTTWTDDENLPLEFFLPFILIYLKIIRKIQAGPGKKYQVSAIEQLIVLKNKINKMLLKICET